MSLDTVQALLSTATFEAMGVRNTVAVADGRALDAALVVASNVVRDIDAACSRFRPGSELSRLNRRAGRAPMRISALMVEALEAALRAAEMTAGLVDPTVGRSVEDVGYLVTFGAMQADGPAIELRVREVAGWRAVDVDAHERTVRLPAGVALDLGASGKAWAADQAASAAAEALGTGVLVECGGDVAANGPAPAGGWPVRVATAAGASDGQDVVIGDGGLATSGTTSRRWRRGGVELHDIIDPRTGLPAATPWSMVTVAAATCLEANAAATAALILGADAPAWLERLALPSRLVDREGTVLAVAGWAA